MSLLRRSRALAVLARGPGLRRRILAALIGLTALLLAGVVVPLGLAQARHDRQVFVDRAVAAAAGAAAGAEERIDDSHDLGTLAARNLGVSDGVSVYAGDGHVLDQHGPALDVSSAQLAASLDGTTVSRVRGDRLVVTTPADGRNGVVGAVAISRSTQPVEDELRRLSISLTVAAVLALAAATGLGLLLANWVAAPLRMLADAADRLGTGDLTSRSNITSGPPEVTSLAVTFDDMAARLEILLRDHRTLLADVSHQLRTPLAAIRLRLELLREDLTTSPAADDVTATLTETARLSRLVDGLLAVARAENVATSPQAVRIEPVLTDRHTAWQPVARERGVTLEITLPPDSLDVIATPGQLEQLLDNLLANAIDATPTGGHIRLAAAHDIRTVTVTVDDSGPGMPPALRERAFHRFWTDPMSGGISSRGEPAESRRVTESAGLGLGIVHRLVTADGGTIALDESSLGGLRVTLNLRRGPQRTPTAANLSRA